MIQFPDQDHVAIFHLQLQRVEAWTLERAARSPGRLQDAVRFYALRLKCVDLAIKGLLAGRYTGVAEESHVWDPVY